MSTNAIIDYRDKTYTYSQMQALTGMRVGDRVYSSTYGQYFLYDSFFGWIPTGTILPEIGYHWIDEAVGANTEMSYTATNAGTQSLLLNATISPTRVLGLSTGTNTNGEYRHTSNAYLLGSVGKKRYFTKAGVDVLSDATNRYVARCGYFNNTTGLALSTGMYFLYDEGGVYGTTTASPNWLCVCYSSGGTASIVNSGVPVATVPTNQLQKLEIFDYGTGNKVEFYINKVLVGTINTQIPINTQSFVVGNVIAKQAGTTARVLYEDFIDVKEIFNTPR